MQPPPGGYPPNPGQPGQPPGYGGPPGGYGGPPGGYGGPPGGYGGPPGGGYGGPPQAVAPGGSYEFSAQENTRIGRAALGAKAFAGLSVAYFGMNVINTILQLLIAPKVSEAIGAAAGTAIGGLIALGVAYFYWSAGTAFSKVVSSEGNDVEHMMNAIGKVGRVFQIEVLITIVAIVLFIVVFVALIFLGVGLAVFR